MIVRGIDDAISLYADKVHKGDRLKAMDLYDEITNYFDLYSNHVLDSTKLRHGGKYCIGEVSFKTAKRRKQFVSIYSKFMRFLNKMTITKRVYMTDVLITCCLDESVRYEPVMKRFNYTEEVFEGMEESLGEGLLWYAIPGMDEVVEKTGDDKCKTLSPSLYLCGWDFITTDAWEEREIEL